MKKFTGFEHGMGIGGWLTNYKRFNVLPLDRRLCLTVGDAEFPPAGFAGNVNIEEKRAPVPLWEPEPLALY